MSERFGGEGPEQPKSQEDAALASLMETFARDIEAFREALAEFQKQHDLDRLRSIEEISPELMNLFTDDRWMSPEKIEEALRGLSPDESGKYRIRVAARKDIIKVTSILQGIERSLSREEWLILWNGALKKEYLPASMAIGMINSGRIRHE